MKTVVPLSNLPRVLIIGGGFGGINIARSLRKERVQVIMLDKNNFHTFQPLLYQVATGGLEPDAIAFPLRKIFTGQDNFVFRVAAVHRIDPVGRIAETDIGDIQYDYLVLATGTDTNFFGMEGIATHAVGLKSYYEAVDLRSLILGNFEEALIQQEQHGKNLLMNLIVVGGGPTGVEMAGALAELKKHVLANDYPELDMRQMEVHLIEAGDKLLPGMSHKSSINATSALDKMGVNVWLNTMVEDFDGSRVKTSTGHDFETATVIWAAGIQGNVIPGLENPSFAAGKRIIVDHYNRVQGCDRVFAIGDLAYMETESWPEGHPQVAPVAIQQAKNLARNLRALLKEQELHPFEYVDKGSMATIGRNKAVMDFRKIHFKGILAWAGWMVIHLLFLMGFRNRLVVLVNWIWSYFTYDHANRLIVRFFEQKKKPAKKSGASSV